MNCNSAKRKMHDEKWDKMGCMDRLVKFVINEPSNDLINWHRKQIHPCRIRLNRVLYRELKNGKEITQYERQMITDEWKAIMDHYGFEMSNYQRSFAYQVVTPYKSYDGRNEGVMQRPANLKEYGSIRFDDGTGIIADLNPAITKNGDPLPIKRNGQLKLTVSGNRKTKKTITESYYIPRFCAAWKRYIVKSFGGNMTPINKGGKLKYVYCARATVEFEWQYKPQTVLSFDIGKRPDVYLTFNTPNNWNDDSENTHFCTHTPELQQLITELRHLNTAISNANKKESCLNTKERKQLRLTWKDVQHQQKQYLKKAYVPRIVEYAIKNKSLLCIDNITTGKTNGEYGQKIVKVLQTECENQRIPFVLVPPTYTSSRCYNCGFIHSDYNTPKQKTMYRPDVDKFICQKCGHMAHADINASKNIALFGWNVWLYEEKYRARNIQDECGRIVDTEIFDIGLKRRRNNNTLTPIPQSMLQFNVNAEQSFNEV